MSTSRRGSLSLAQVQADDELLDRLGARSSSVPDRSDALVAAFVALTEQVEAPHLHAVPSPMLTEDDVAARARLDRRRVLPRPRRRPVAVPALRSRTARRILRPATGAAVAMSMVLFGSGVAAAIGDDPFDPVGQVAAAVRGIIGPAPSVPVVAEDLRRDLEQALRQLQREQPEAAREIVEGVRRDAVLLPADQEQDLLAEADEVSAQLPAAPITDLDPRGSQDRAQRGARADLQATVGDDASSDERVRARSGQRFLAGGRIDVGGEGVRRWAGADGGSRDKTASPTAPVTPGVQDDAGRPGAATDRPTMTAGPPRPTMPVPSLRPTRPSVLVPSRPVTGPTLAPVRGGITRPQYGSPTTGPAGPRPTASSPLTPGPGESAPASPGPTGPTAPSAGAPEPSDGAAPTPAPPTPTAPTPTAPTPAAGTAPATAGQSSAPSPDETGQQGSGEAPAAGQVPADPADPSGPAATEPGGATGADGTTP